MARKKEYEEKQKHGTVEVPVGLHKMHYPQGTDVIFYLHWHPEFEILMVTEGRIHFVIEDRTYLLEEGEAVFINSNLLHSARTVDGEACSFFAVDFHYQLLHEDIHSTFARKYINPVLEGKVIFPEFISEKRPEAFCREELHNPKYKRKSLENTMRLDGEIQDRLDHWQETILQLLTNLNACPEHDVNTFELLMRSHVMAMWDLLNRHSAHIHRGADGDPRGFGRLEPVISYMQKNYAYEMTLSELAGILPMSEGQFCRVFKQTMQMSPMQYLMRYRILQSCRLLQDTDKKIGEIANLSGFNNISYFNKVFLQTIGCTPKEYRNNGQY